MEIVPLADVSLLHGLLPSVLGATALCALGLAAVRPDRRWLVWRLLPIVVISLLLVVVVNWRLDLEQQFDDVIPLEFLVWAAMPVAAIGIAVFGWRGDVRWRRAVAILAIPLTLMYAANLINQYYGYEPSVGALFGTNVNDQVDPSQLGLQLPSADVGTSTTTKASAVPPGGTGPAKAAVPSPAAAPTPVVLAAPLAAGSGHGVVSTLDIPGTVSGFSARTAYVWVPPAFFATPRPHLPVIVMLSGVPGQPNNMIRAAGATVAADQYSASHGGRAPIVVFADNNGSFGADTECVDDSQAKAETYLTVDVPAYVERVLSAAPGPTNWGVEGYSEGGTCAMDLALAHPDVYGTFVDISGDAFPNAGTRGDAKATAIAKLYDGDASLFDAHDPTLLAVRPQDHGVAGWFEDGTSDHRKADVGATLDAELRADGLESHLVIAPGGHDFAMATHAVADSFAWLSHRLGS